MKSLGYLIAVLAGLGATVFAFLGIAVHFGLVTVAQIDGLTEFDNYVLAGVLAIVAIGAYVLDTK